METETAKDGSLGPGSQASTGQRSRQEIRLTSKALIPKIQGPEGKERREASLEGSGVRGVLPGLCVVRPSGSETLSSQPSHQLFLSVPPCPGPQLTRTLAIPSRPPRGHTEAAAAAKDLRGRKGQAGDREVLVCARRVPLHLTAGPYHPAGQ